MLCGDAHDAGGGGGCVSLRILLVGLGITKNSDYHQAVNIARYST